ncbi:MAG: glycosyltransferase family 2 protein [Solirubrobacteraceae bacterium]
MPAGPAVAVVVVCHDSAQDIAGSLPTVLDQLEPCDELIVVDNASSDWTADVVRAVAPRAIVVRSGVNLGFAGGANLGASSAGAPLLFFLNPDARLQLGCLAALRRGAVQKPSWGALQALVTLPGGELVNTAGNPVHFLGFGWAGDHGCPVPAAGAELREVPTASGAALVVRREAWDAAGGFEECYFMYGEDLDLSLRLRAMGWTIGLVPDARVEHDYEFVKGDYKWFHLERNRWWTLLGVYPTRLLILLIPALLAFELVLLPAAWRGGWLGAKLRAQFAVLRSLRRSLRRRRRIQPPRIDPTRFAQSLTAALDSEFLGAAGRSKVVLGGLSAYWRCVVRGL